MTAYDISDVFQMWHDGFRLKSAYDSEDRPILERDLHQRANLHISGESFSETVCQRFAVEGESEWDHPYHHSHWRFLNKKWNASIHLQIQFRRMMAEFK